jgi:hypothetical protein
VRKPHLWILDSRPQQIEADQIAVYNKIRKTLKRLRWEKYPITYQRTIGIFGPPTIIDVAEQDASSRVCGIHTTLNAWVVAMELVSSINIEFVGDPDFYADALRLMNLAMTGSMDFICIYAFLRCTNYTIPRNFNGDRPKHLNRTVPFRSANELIARVIDVRNAEQKEIDSAIVEERRKSEERNSGTDKPPPTPSTVRELNRLKLIDFGYPGAADLPGEIIRTVMRLLKHQGIDVEKDD